MSARVKGDFCGGCGQRLPLPDGEVAAACRDVMLELPAEAREVYLRMIESVAPRDVERLTVVACGLVAVELFAYPDDLEGTR